MEENTLISIIVPCYNQAQYLDECLQSVLDQTYQNWECIIINDGSTDQTGEIAKKWEKRDSRFVYLKKENGGVASARNIGLEKAKGDWIQFLDGDDTISSSKFDESLLQGDNFNFVYTDFSLLENNKITDPFCDLKSNIVSIENLIKYWDQGLNIPIHTPIIKRELIGNLRFNVNFKLHEDWLFWIQLLQNPNIEIKFINKSLVLYRVHLANNSSKTTTLLENQKAVYSFAYSEILKPNEQAILFSRFINDYYLALDKKSFYAEFYNKTVNSRYYKIKSLLYKIMNRF